VGPSAPWPNSHAYNQLYEIRVVYWELFQYHIQGFLYWSAVAYYHGGYGFAYNGWGDGWFIYINDAGQVFDSIRWDNYRMAAQDYEYLWLMNATINALGHDPYAISGAKILNDTLNSVVIDTYNYCNSANVVNSARDTIGSWLNQIVSTGKVNMTALGEAQWIS
jgi:hypothetical protein